jgi:hypothetical protein
VKQISRSAHWKKAPLSNNFREKILWIASFGDVAFLKNSEDIFKI